MLHAFNPDIIYNYKYKPMERNSEFIIPLRSQFSSFFITGYQFHRIQNVEGKTVLVEV